MNPLSIGPTDEKLSPIPSSRDTAAVFSLSPQASISLLYFFKAVTLFCLCSLNALTNELAPKICATPSQVLPRAPPVSFIVFETSPRKLPSADLILLPACSMAEPGSKSLKLSRIPRTSKTVAKEAPTASADLEISLPILLNVALIRIPIFSIASLNSVRSSLKILGRAFQACPKGPLIDLIPVRAIFLRLTKPSTIASPASLTPTAILLAPSKRLSQGVKFLILVKPLLRTPLSSFMLFLILSSPSSNSVMSNRLDNAVRKDVVKEAPTTSADLEISLPILLSVA